LGMAYLGSVLLLTWQALRGQPLLHPDFKTLVAASLLAAGAAVAVLFITIRPRISGDAARRSPSGNAIPISGGSMNKTISTLVVILMMLSLSSFADDAAKQIPDAPFVQTQTSSSDDSSQTAQHSSQPSLNSRAPATESQPAQSLQTNGNAGL